MLLTLSTTHRPATDLGFLLMKHPDNVHRVSLPFGQATVFFPDASDARCTAALTLEVDPVELVRGKPGGSGGIQDQYVNDRPYAASSLLTVALGRALGTAMSGRSRHRQDLADRPMPLEVTVTPLRVRGQDGIVERLFAPLGYRTTTDPLPLDTTQPERGDSPYVTLHLAADMRLADLLAHLTVLIPVLDNAKHYYIGEDEVTKLLRRGAGWLAAHPEREFIVRRYLRNFGALVRLAEAGLAPIAADEAAEDAVPEVERPLRLHDTRIAQVAEVIASLAPASVVDLGCGEGRLLRELLKQPGLQRILGMDISPRALELAAARLHLDRMGEAQRQRLTLVQGALTYRDDRLQGFDVAAVVEVIEHMDAERLPAFERALFGHARPGAVVLTTPNRDYNALFPTLAAGALRHSDHRFEWTRAEFAAWAGRVAEVYGYSLRILPVGPEDAALGAPTQMGVFTR